MVVICPKAVNSLATSALQRGCNAASDLLSTNPAKIPKHCYFFMSFRAKPETFHEVTPHKPLTTGEHL
jgi:hypothetical protein